MAGQGSGDNILATLDSLAAQGLGHFFQGRTFETVMHLLRAAGLRVLTLGMLDWALHVTSALDAAMSHPAVSEFA